MLFDDAQFDDVILKFAFGDCQHRATESSAHMLTRSAKTHNSRAQECETDPTSQPAHDGRVGHGPGRCQAQRDPLESNQSGRAKASSCGEHERCETVMWVKVRMWRNVCELACGRGEIFFYCLYSSCVRACVTQCALVVAVILKCSTFLAVISEYLKVGVIFSLTSLLCSLYWHWDPLSSLESTPLSRSRSQNRWTATCVGLVYCFSFFSCKDGSDRLMKRASQSSCNFLCIVLAAAYLKYCWYRLSCLPFVCHFFSL